MPMLISAAYAQTTGIGILDNQGALIQFLPIVLIFVDPAAAAQSKRPKDDARCAPARRPGGDRRRYHRHRRARREPRGSYGRHRRWRPCPGAAQHDLERARQTRPGGGARGGQAEGGSSGQGRNQELTSFYRYETAWYALFRKLENCPDLRDLRARRVVVAAEPV